MAYTTLIASKELYPHLHLDNWVILDCRFSLGDPNKGRIDYLASHIPGARYVHLDEDLSGPIIDGQTGRHPLPDLESFASKLRSWGIDHDTQVVAYDDMGGPFAARLWWMLQWLGHEKAAVLDGGLPAWIKSGYQTDNSIPTLSPSQYTPSLASNHVVSAGEVMNRLESSGTILVDARAEPRFAGVQEPIDPIAGHIPGAVSYPFKGNLTEEGTFKSPEALKERFQSLAQPSPHTEVICYCGSGVTAAHNVLAMVHAGLPFPLMYPGSWSEWITDPSRPIGKSADK